MTETLEISSLVYNSIIRVDIEKKTQQRFDKDTIF